ncbi:MAG TPA: DUF2155 domain-containing protein, partial [Caulobacteraceae bacterium]
MGRPGIAVAALALGLSVFGMAAAQDAQEAEPAPQAAPTLPAAPIPYTQLRKPKTTTVIEEEPAAPKEAVEPMRRPRANAAILQALDKVTAETMRFEAQVGQPVRYKDLIFTVRACETAAPDEIQPFTAAYVTIDLQPRPRPGQARRPSRQVFRGWMFANSPSLDPL